MDSRTISLNLAYGYYPVSPYAYCLNNPVRYVDPDGRVVGDFRDEKGNLIGTDGINDGKVYVLKTSQTSFGESASVVSGAGIAKAYIKATANFIKTNSGNTQAFTDNPIAYNNSIEIEGSTSNRQAMVEAVSLDIGAGGASPANNSEYGGSIQD